MTIRSPSGNDADTIIKEIDIAAPTSVVWKALTDERGLTNWLPLEAAVKPGRGGYMKMSWGEPITEESSIEIWDPDKHLRLKEIRPFGHHFEPLISKYGSSRVVDYELAPSGNNTTLRLTHTGFAAPPTLPVGLKGRETSLEVAGFAAELSPLGFRNTVAACWEYQLNALGDYCENHVGESRVVSWIRQPIQMSFAAAWDRLSGPGSTGLLHAPSAPAWDRVSGWGLTSPLPAVAPPRSEKTSFLSDLAPGDRYSFHATTGDTFTGRVLTYTPNKQFGGTVDNMGGLLRILCSFTLGRPDVTIWLARYSSKQRALTVADHEWNQLVAQRWQFELARTMV
jgi:uncharacterized protein YndB with AHSA1/START domain